MRIGPSAKTNNLIFSLRRAARCPNLAIICRYFFFQKKLQTKLNKNILFLSIAKERGKKKQKTHKNFSKKKSKKNGTNFLEKWDQFSLRLFCRHFCSPFFFSLSSLPLSSLSLSPTKCLPLHQLPHSLLMAIGFRDKRSGART